jgi:hypothetical protein
LGVALRILRLTATCVAVIVAIVFPAPAAGARPDPAAYESSSVDEGLYSTPVADESSAGEHGGASEPVTTVEPVPPPDPLRVVNPDSCLTNDEPDPLGGLETIAGLSDRSGPGRLWTFRVEVQAGLAIDADCFAGAIERTLWDERSWGGTGRVAFQRVDDESYNFKIILASPDLTDRLCRPLRTGGIYSCRSGNRVVVNFWRWQNGASSFDRDLTTYRHYLINHEVGHMLGYGHRSCGGSGRLAPVMMQQTKGVGACVPNGWPYAG